MTGPAPEISIVIPTHNRRASLFRLLQGLAQGTVSPERFEVIVVADGCTDDTIEALEAATVPFQLESFTVDPGRGAATARNRGAREARGPIVLFIDDDIEPLPGLLEAHLRIHRESTGPTAVIGAPLPVRKPAVTFHQIAIWGWWDQQFERMEQPGHRFSYDQVFGGILSLPRALFESLGAFDEDFNGCREDPELGLRLIGAGVRIAFSRPGGGHHYEVRSLPQMLARKRAEGRSDVLLAERYPGIWTTLQASTYGKGSASLRRLRRLAVLSPRLGAAFFGGGRLLAFLERIRFRKTWRGLHGATMYFAYWRGVAEQTGGGHRSLERLSDLARTAAQVTRKPEPACEIDLALGLPAAEALLDAERPASAWFRLGGADVGVIPELPGCERMAGRHLRPALRDFLAEPLRAALSLQDLVKEGLPPNKTASRFSIVVPACNAEATLARTVESVRRQTIRDWELLIVDDGSVDETTRVASEAALADPRIRVVHQRRQGPSAARNAGIRRTSGEWLLFLDADDWIAPTLLERAGEELAKDPTLDAVHFGWETIRADGTAQGRRRSTAVGDLFPHLARRPLFAIHACVVRRRFAVEAGGFPIGRDRCEDWLFWQRVARLGARFGAAPEYLASYRLRADSLSADPLRLFEAAAEVIAIGHGRDPALPDSTRMIPEMPGEPEGAWILHMYSAAATLAVAGNDPSPLLERKGPIASHPYAESAAEALSEPLIGALRVERDDALGRCRRFLDRIDPFLERVSAIAAVPGLDRSIRLALLRRIAEAGVIAPPWRLGPAQVVAIDVGRRLVDHPVEHGVERFRAEISFAGRPLGSVELPVCEDSIPAGLLADAIADRFGWAILGAFFATNVYAGAEYESLPDGTTTARLPGRPPITGLPPAEPARTDALHDRVGWAVFVDELWNPVASGVVTEPPEPGPIVVEVTAPMPSLALPGTATLDVRAGGASLGLLAVPGASDAGALRELITSELGYELCRVAVREAIVGQPLGGASLRARLEAAAGSGGIGRTLELLLGPDRGGAAIGRRPGARRGTAADRRALLPGSLTEEILAGEIGAGTPVRVVDPLADGRLAYVPELALTPDHEVETTAPTDRPAATFRFHFEATFAGRPDPWRYETDYEQIKYRQTLEVLPNVPFGSALELACAEGHFTRMLAGRVDRLLATDISEIALTRAAARCRDLSNVELARLDIRLDELPAGLDLVVCSEMLYYLADESELGRVAAKLAGALGPGGYVLTTHAKTAVDEPDHTGFGWTVPFGSATIGRVLGETPGLDLAVEMETPLYRILLHRKSGAESRESVRIVSDEFALPRSEVAAQIRWTPGVPPPPPRPVSIESDRVPILMYHRIADSGEPSRDRYRVSPARFAEQLGFLRDCGFRSISLEEWRRAALARRPVPGRPIIITFDDGFADFEEHAWPALERHGFGALVFLVTGSVGRWNEWDERGTEEPLLDWEAVARLHAQGVEFGAHGVTHRHSTALTPADVVREAIGSRFAIERRLRGPVRAFAYPYGDEDEAVRHLVGASGFCYGMTTKPGTASFHTPLLGLPRIEIPGNADLADFVAAVSNQSSG